MSHLILEGPLQTSFLIWDLVFADAPYPHRGLASSLKRGTSWKKLDIIPYLILKGPLQTSSLTWDLVFTYAPYPQKGQASSLRHGTSWKKSNIMPHLILEGPLQTSSHIWDLVFADAPYPLKDLASSLKHDDMQQLVKPGALGGLKLSFEGLLDSLVDNFYLAIYLGDDMERRNASQSRASCKGF
ncbi:hypothetical protein Adt_23626 [Abeliophyllum distichum]|uniref:Uncharacterized protein n=1 Tax=Abeliophyllum distichum TaxID=126358 RepID=A0ABD1SC85_9LAMI